MNILRKIIDFIKEAFNRMFGNTQLEKLTGKRVILSQPMIERLELWDKMLCGKAPWTDETENYSGVKSLGLEGAVCSEFANVTLSEMETSLDNDKLNELYQKALRNFNEHFQTGLGLGSMVIKPIGNTGNVEYIPADRIIPFEFGDDGSLRKVAFIQVKEVSDKEKYYRLEFHELTPEGLRIQNKAYKGVNGEIGNQVPLTSIEEWAQLYEDILYRGMDRMDFGYYRNPLPNRIDKSKNGVSIFEKAVEQIKKADQQFGRLDWEYASGERFVFADYTTVKKAKDGSFSMPKSKERLLIPYDADTTNGDKTLDEFSPTMRDASYIAGLNEYKRLVEFNCCLAYGDLSKNESVEKTAKEIKASENRKYNMVNAIQMNLKSCLEDLAHAIAFYQAMFTVDFGFNCTFHDSIKTDEETERAQDRIDVASGFMSPVEYRMKWYGEDEATAMSKIAEIRGIITEGEQP